ncbi:MAG TPA: helicase-associated domain-containing protein [Acidimicrobiales bacterium]|nr:helicase-associated domain-containing protein [Acidimicrobiales bacterium]
MVTQRIATLDEDGLCALVTSRPDLADPSPRSLAELVGRAGSVGSVQRCIDRLDRFSRQVMLAAVVLGSRPTVAGIRRLLGDEVPDAALERALGELQRRALLVREGDVLVLLAALATMQAPAGLGPPAALALEQLTVEELKLVASELGAPLGGATRKPELVAALAGGLSDAKLIRRVLERAPAGANELARRLAGGPPLVTNVYGLAGAYVRRSSGRSDTDPVVWLARRGLVVRDEWYAAVMPREVSLVLRGGRLFASVDPERPVLGSSEIGGAEVDRLATARALSTLADIERLVEQMGRRPAALLKAGGLGVRELRKLAGALELAEAEVTLLVELAGIAGLVCADPRSSSALPSAACDDWLEQDTAGRWRTLVEAWLEAPSHACFAGALDANGKPQPALLRWERSSVPGEQRRLALGILAELGPGRAASLEDHARVLEWDAPGLFAYGPIQASVAASWIRREAQTLGLIALDALSGLGRSVAAGELGVAAASLAAGAPARATSIVLQADLTAIAPGHLPTKLRRELELIADVESSGSATVFRFSEASLRRGFDAGRDGAELLDFLAEHATKGVPQALSYLVGDVARRHGQLRVGAAESYVRFEDPAVAAEVLRARRTARLGLRELASTVLVTHVRADVVLSVLRDAGYLPGEEDATGALVAAAPAVHRAGAATAGRRAGEPTGSVGARPGVLSGAELPLDLARRLRTGADESAPSAPPRSVSTARAVAAGRDQLRLLGQDDDDEAEHATEADVGLERPLGVAAQLAAADDGGQRSSAGGRTLARLLQLAGVDGVDGGPARPGSIAKGRDEVGALLEQACEEEWFVRISYSSAKGRTAELVCAVLDVTRDSAIVARMPTGAEQQLAVGRVQWARVLTDAEEERWT